MSNEQKKTGVVARMYPYTVTRKDEPIAKFRRVKDALAMVVKGDVLTKNTRVLWTEGAEGFNAARDVRKALALCTNRELGTEL
jgi:hypothetical protein